MGRLERKVLTFCSKKLLNGGQFHARLGYKRVFTRLIADQAIEARNVQHRVGKDLAADMVFAIAPAHFERFALVQGMANAVANGNR